MKSSDIARGRQAIEEERIRRLVRQHQQRQKSLLKDEFLPRAGIVGLLAGWFLMSSFDNIFNRLNKQ